MRMGAGRCGIAALAGVAVVGTILLTCGGTPAGASSGTTWVIGGCTIGTKIPPQGASCSLRDVRLVGARLVKADLSGADLSGAYLSGADLAGANLSSAKLIGTHLNEADVAGANVTGADLSGADLTRADLAGSFAQNAMVTGVTWGDTICPDFSDSTGDGGTCDNLRLAGSAGAVLTASAPAAPGGGGVLAYTGFPTAKAALLGIGMVVLGLVLLFCPAPVRIRSARGRTKRAT